MDETDEISIHEAALAVARALGFEVSVIPREVATHCTDAEILFAAHVTDVARQGEVIFDQSRADGQYKKTASNAKLRGYLPAHKFTPFLEAIQSTCTWFKENYSKTKK